MNNQVQSTSGSYARSICTMWVSSIICTWCRRAPPLLVFSQVGGAGQ